MGQRMGQHEDLRVHAAARSIQPPHAALVSLAVVPSTLMDMWSAECVAFSRARRTHF
jgi:hypothetical protein